MTTSELIKKLQQLEDEHGELDINIYKSFDKQTINNISTDDVHYDEDKNDVYIGIYN